MCGAWEATCSVGIYTAYSTVQENSDVCTQVETRKRHLDELDMMRLNPSHPCEASQDCREGEEVCSE